CRDPSWIKMAIFSDVVEGYLGCHELHQILVVRDDDYLHIHILCRSLLCQGADEIVGLILVVHKYLQAQGTRYGLAVVQLPREVGRRQGAVGFIGREKRITEGRS